MKRIEAGIKPRPNWRDLVMREGLVYVDTEVVDPDSGDTKVVSYWREDTYYWLSKAEVDLVAAVSRELFNILIAAGDYAIEHNLFAHMGIPTWAIPGIRASWEETKDGRYWPNIYGRFDLRLQNDSRGNIADVRLLEYNAQTPTGMVETAITQWNWLLWHLPEHGQFNELYEKLVTRWVEQIGRWQTVTDKKLEVLHLAHTSADKSGEDAMNVGLMGSAAEEAAQRLGTPEKPAFQVKFITVESIKCHEPVYEGDTTEYIVTTTGTKAAHDPGNILGGQPEAYFYDADGVPIQMIFALYPWEQMVHEEGGRQICWNMMQTDGTVWVEPICKMLWSNKAILAILWHLYKDDPVRSQYLLPTYFEDDNLPEGFEATPEDLKRNCARKPIFGREGNSVILYQDGVVIAGKAGVYSDELHILQALALLPGYRSELEQKTYHPVAGVWTVGDEPVALIIRESEGFITGNTSFCVPHATDRSE